MTDNNALTTSTLLKKARDLLKAKNHQEALKCYQSIEKTTIDDDILWESCEAYIGAGLYTEAKIILEDLYGRNWRRNEVCLGLARLADIQKQYERAAIFLEEAREIAPLSPRDLPFLARQLIIAGQLSSALDVLRQAKTVSSGARLITCNQLAFSIHREQQDWRAAEECLTDILAIDPTNQAAWLGLVEVAARRHDHKTVIDRITRALAVVPADPRLLAIRKNSQVLDRSNRGSSDDVPRVLMLSTTVPGASRAGGRYVQSLVDLYPRDRLAFFCVTSIKHFSLPPDLAWLPIAFAIDPVPSNKGSINGAERISARAAAWQAALAADSREIAEEVVRFAQIQRAEVILVLMNPRFFRIVREIRAASSHNIALIVSDPPEYQLNTHRVPVALHKSLMEDFSHAMQIADRCAAVSENMAEEYMNAFGHEPLIMRHALRGELQRTGRRRLLIDGRITIAVLGGIYAADAITAFVNALVAAEWKIGDRRVSLICMTPSLPPGADSSMPIEYLGWLDQDDAVKVLERADLGYIPYWFDDHYHAAVRLCFPSKVSPIAASGIPIFFHGPAHSSVARFLERHPMGFVCSSLDPSVILAQLHDFIATPGRFAAAAVAAEAAFSEEMSHDVFRARLMRLVGAKTVVP